VVANYLLIPNKAVPKIMGKLLLLREDTEKTLIATIFHVMSKIWKVQYFIGSAIR